MPMRPMTRDVSSGPNAAIATRSAHAPLHPTGAAPFATRVVGATLADDAVQDTLIIVARKLNWLEEPRLFRAWPSESRRASRSTTCERRGVS